MSIKFSIQELELKIRQKITKDLVFIPNSIRGKQKFHRKNDPIKTYHIDKDKSVYLPFFYSLSAIPGSSRPPRENYKSVDFEFKQELRACQKDVKKEIIGVLNRQGSCILSFYPGFGKTSLSIYLSSKIGLKTLVIVHRLVLIEQWVESISKFCPSATCSVIKPKYKREQLDSDFLIINAINVEKIGYEAFKDVGLLIVDEIHTIATESLSRSLFHVTPRYLLGLSATPHRSDGMDIILDTYFGKTKITKSLYRPHIVYRVDTGFTPEIQYNSSGGVDWGSVIEFQSTHVERNQMILNIVKKYDKNHILILCKRINQATYLINKLEEMKENVTSLIGSNTTYNRDCRVMVATVQKCGVGFDFSKLNMLILAADVQEYFVQYLGRVMRTEEGEPIVFDLVDDNTILKRHFSTRKKVYSEAGGKIMKMKIAI